MRKGLLHLVYDARLPWWSFGSRCARIASGGSPCTFYAKPPRLTVISRELSSAAKKVQIFSDERLKNSST
jgi:hypothetical protein